MTNGAGITVVYDLDISFTRPTVKPTGGGAAHCQRGVTCIGKVKIGPHFQGYGAEGAACAGSCLTGGLSVSRLGGCPLANRGWALAVGGSFVSTTRHSICFLVDGIARLFILVD